MKIHFYSACVLLFVISPMVIAATVDIEFSSSYVATPQSNGDKEIVVTATMKRMHGSGGVTSGLPLQQFLEQAGNKECPSGFDLLSQDLQKTHKDPAGIRWTQRSIIHCKPMQAG